MGQVNASVTINTVDITGCDALPITITWVTIKLEKISDRN